MGIHIFAMTFLFPFVRKMLTHSFLYIAGTLKLCRLTAYFHTGKMHHILTWRLSAIKLLSVPVFKVTITILNVLCRMLAYLLQQFILL